MTTTKPKVILDHDGGIDDIVALAILAGYHEKVELIGVVCIDADCFIDPAVQVSAKVLSGMQVYGRAQAKAKGGEENPFEYLGKVPVGRSTLTAVHEFPREWRADAIKMNDLPCLNTPCVLEQYEANKKHEVYAEGSSASDAEPKYVAGEEFLADLVMTRGSPTDKVSICVTGPLSNIAYCVKKYGKKFTDNVEAVIIMGGAVDVHGNVYTSGREGGEKESKAEWNIYWDAPSGKTVLECPDLKNILFSLDATNHVPVHSAFVKRFGAKKEGSFLSEFIGSSWAMMTFFEAVYGADHAYYAWDALTAAWVVKGDGIAEDLEKVPIVVIDEKGSVEEGRTKRLAQSEAAEVNIVSNVLVPRKVHATAFYDMMLELAARV